VVVVLVVIVLVVVGHPRLLCSQHHACFEADQASSHLEWSAAQSYGPDEWGDWGQSNRCAQHHFFFGSLHAVCQRFTSVPQSYRSTDVVATTRVVVLVLVLDVTVVLLCAQPRLSCSQHHFFFCADHHIFQ
jgi:hypothetical protein